MANSSERGNEETPCIQPNVNEADFDGVPDNDGLSDASHGSTSLLHHTEGTNNLGVSLERSCKPHSAVLVKAIATALVIGINEGYTMNANTTYVGHDMDAMQTSVLIILLPAASGAAVPAFIPFLSTLPYSMFAGALIMALGFLGSGLAGTWCKPLLLGLAQALSGVGVGLLNLLTNLDLRSAAKDSGAYPWYRACYTGLQTLGMCAGALGGTALIELVDSTGFAPRVRPWQIPYWLESAFVLILGAFPDTARSGAEGATFDSVGSDMLETGCVALCAITPAVFVGFWTLHDVPWWFFILAFALEIAFLFGSGLVRRYKKTRTLFAETVYGSERVLLLVVIRATLSVAVKLLTFRLPLYAQIHTMIEAVPDKQHHLPDTELPHRRACNATNNSAVDFKQNVVLPAYYFGESTGGLAGASAIKLLSSESASLLVSLLSFFFLVLPFGYGAFRRLGLRSMATLTFAGLGYGAADTCLSAFLFSSVEEKDRPFAEAFSSLAGNFAVTLALAFAQARYEALLTTDLISKFGKAKGIERASTILKDIRAADNFPGSQRADILQYAQKAIEQIIFETQLTLVAGVVAAVVLYGFDRPIAAGGLL